MNKDYIIYNLKEALQELSRTINDIEKNSKYDTGEYLVAMQHLYHHINTAWNARESSLEESNNCTEENFYAWREFPTEDFYMGI